MTKLRKKAMVARRARRLHTGAFKAQVALAALREDKTLAQLSNSPLAAIPMPALQLEPNLTQQEN